MCDYVMRQETIDYAEYMPAGTGTGTHNVYCERAPQFWVQSLLSTHNSHACPHHLARIVREIEEAARQFDITTVDRKPDARYSRDSQMLKVGMTKEQSNYARVTVKPYARKVH